MIVSEHVRIFADEQSIPYEHGDEVQVMPGEPDDQRIVTRGYAIRLDSQDAGDKTIGYPLSVLCEHFGKTGWDWLNRQTKWVLVADFDVADDGKKTPRTVTTEEMDQLIGLLSAIPWLTLKRSKGGNGVHAFAQFDEPVDAENRAAHQAIAYAVRALVESIIGEPMPADKTGSVAYVWTRHRKPNSFAIIKEATEKLKASDLPERETTETTEYESIKLTDRHRSDLEILNRSACPPQFDAASGAYRVHTATLHLIDANLKTASAGRDLAHPNAFMYPQPDGSWPVYRYGGAKEHESWHHEDGKTWTVLNPIQFDFDMDSSFNAFPADEFARTTIGAIIDRSPELSPPLIDGLIRLAETMNIIAPPKVGKSWLVYLIALSIVSGRDLFGFPCRAGRVLLIDNELHEPVIASRIPAVAKALGIEDYRNKIDVVSLRGRLLDLDKVGSKIVSRIEHGEYVAVVCDAFYRFLPTGSGGENDNAMMAKAYNTIDGFAAKTRAAWLLIHHSAKGNQSEKSVTDVGAGAGAQSRATDCHLILRAHEEPGHVVLDAVTRSFPPPEPLVLRWAYPTWTVAEGMDPAALQQPKKARQQLEDTNGREAILDALRSGPDSARGLMAKVGMSYSRVDRLLGQLVSAGQVNFDVEIRRGNACRVYRSTCA